MTVLIYDVETTGRMDYSAPEKLDAQPHIVRFTLGVYEDGELDSIHSFRTRPEGYTISEAASAVNGITQRDAAQRGISMKTNLSVLCQAVKTASICASFGFDSFDAPMVRTELARLGIFGQFPPAGVESFCIKKAATPICKVPDEDGGYRAPSLETASLTILKHPITSRNAMDRLSAVAALYFELRAIGL
jgi:hypothetical protein